MTASERRDYGTVVTEQRDGVRILTVQARQRGLMRPARVVRLGVERHGTDTEVAVLSLAEVRELAALLLEVARDDEP